MKTMQLCALALLACCFASTGAVTADNKALGVPVFDGDVPATPKDYPATPNNSYKPLNTGYSMSVVGVKGSTYYELLQSSTDANYDVVARNKTGKFHRPGASKKGYIYYRYRACNAMGCSGLSPYRRLYTYVSPSAVRLSVPSQAKLGAKLTITWPQAKDIIYNPISYYHLQVKTPAGTTQKLNLLRSGSQILKLSTVVTPNQGVGTYEYRVRACNPSLPCSAWSSARVSVFQLAEPVPQYPLANAKFVDGQELNIRFKWRTVKGASGYDFYLFDRSESAIVFRQQLASKECGSSCSIAPHTDLTVANNHVWRVAALFPSGDKSAFSYVPFHVTSANSAPKISGKARTSALENQFYSFQPQASDPDGDKLSFSIVNKPKWAQFSRASGLLSGTPSYDDAGIYKNITLTVSDGRLNASLGKFDIEVKNNNRRPVISGHPQSSVKTGKYFQFTPASSDPDGDALTFDISGLPNWAKFNKATGQLFGTPVAKDLGWYKNIRISVSDGSARASLAKFNIRVLNDNSRPSISGNPPTTAEVGVLYRFTPVAMDPDGDKLSFSIINKPKWLQFNTADGVLSGTPQISNLGVYKNLQISVYDGENRASLPRFNLTVKQQSEMAVSYSYDPLGRLISISNSTGQKLSYQFDEAGNRTRVGRDENE